MPDRYGDPADPEPVVDFDSRRQARDTAAAIENAAQQRQRLSESRSVHAPLTRDQSDAARTHRTNTTNQAETHRNTLRIANCQLCDDDGYTPAGQVCDHIDHRPAAARGMQLVREALQKGENA